MTELNEEQHYMLTQYKELLSGMREGLSYIQANLTEEAPPQVSQVFQDLLVAFEQINKVHSQMLIIFNDHPKVVELVEQYKSVVEDLTLWFKVDSNQAKQQLLTDKVLPAFDEWKNNTDQFLKPYITH
ncbi:hypothetical protein NC661_14695 [Aquibacillus koreensis]|uniref:DUF8042 domain-containing protein n=1 Tax=Aquibacillus koreensis TaxID=279446 RepID=A0A9X3WQL4_9BACI|nr:hypothetical protein [Aquibacillus koreensis]MCT2537272.1 hypothetical protein [Aquibacillus koreensis]MDC3421619.1 hypothetical protein [Aquibacillus koreensis]